MRTRSHVLFAVGAIFLGVREFSFLGRTSVDAPQCSLLAYRTMCCRQAVMFFRGEGRVLSWVERV